MKIALVIGNYNGLGGGAERWTDRHARYLIARGHDVHLYARTIREAPREAVQHPVKARGRLKFASTAADMLRVEEFDAVHDMGDGWYCDVFMPHHGTRQGGFERNTAMLSPAVRRLRSLAQQWLPRYRQFRELEALQYAPSPGKVFIALSEMVRTDMMRFNRTPPECIRVVYNGVDAAAFRPAWTAGDFSERAAARRSWGIDDSPAFLLVAHNFRLKGLESAIRALAEFQRGGRKAWLVVAGGDEPGPFRRLASRLGCEDLVRFVGNLPNPSVAFRAADVYLHPTYYDPCSLVLLEALACGLPVITTRYNGAGELIEPGREGFLLAEPSDHSRLAELMERMFDEKFRKKAGFAARQLAERRTLAANSDNLIAIYRSVSSQRRAA